MFDGGIEPAFVEVGAEAARAVMGDEGAEGAAEVFEMRMAGGVELGGDFVGDFDFAEEGEVVSVSLVGEVDGGAVFERF